MSLSIENNNFRIYNTQKFIESLLQNQLSINNLYVWIGRTLPWSNDSSPDIPQDTVSSRIETYDTLLAIKKVSPSDIVAVIPNHIWTPGIIYTEYYDLGEIGSDGIYHDIFDPSITGTPFYVITDQNNVYKCLGNNNGTASTIQPTGTGTTTFKTSDGYIWKFMFQVSIEDIQQFLIAPSNGNPGWIPVRNINYNDGSLQWLVQTTAIPGSINNIQVLNGGNSYVPIASNIDYGDQGGIFINGDGSGLVISINVSPIGGHITGFNILNPGQNYTWAQIDVNWLGASGATFHVIISPPGGHGSNPLYELGAMYAMINLQFNYDENGKVSTDTSYRSYGLLLNPTIFGSNNYFTGLVGSGTTNLTVSGVTSAFTPGEFIVGTISLASAYVVDYNNVTNVLRVIPFYFSGENVGVQNGGTFVIGDQFEGQNGTITNIIFPDIQLQSGLILTTENMTPIFRAPTQSENISIVLPF